MYVPATGSAMRTLSVVVLTSATPVGLKSDARNVCWG